MVAGAGEIGGGLLIASVTLPEPITTVGGLGLALVGAKQLSSSSVAVKNGLTQMVDSFFDVSNSGGISLDQAIAQNLFPDDVSSQQLVVAGGLSLDLITGRAVFRAPTAASRSQIFSNADTLVATSNAFSSMVNSVENLFSVVENQVLTSNTDFGASGGFVLYPNKPNTNLLNMVYRK